MQGVEHTREQEYDHFESDGVTVESVFAETAAVDKAVCFHEDIWDETLTLLHTNSCSSKHKVKATSMSNGYNCM